jgi:hypothetical protein
LGGLDVKEIGRWSGDLNGMPAALTQSGEVYADTVGGVVKLDRAARQWKPISFSLPGDRLLGAMNDNLVVVSYGDNVLRYVDPPR